MANTAAQVVTIFSSNALAKFKAFPTQNVNATYSYERQALRIVISSFWVVEVALLTSLVCIAFLIRQRQSFRGHHARMLSESGEAYALDAIWSC